MQFLNPAAFYLLGLVPIVVALHFLKLRRRTHLVSSILFWLSADEDRRANVPFQRLRNLLLPFLQVLFLGTLITSLARPALQRPGIIPGKVVLIVDNSASLASNEMGPSRLALAKQEAQRYIKNVSASGGTMLMVTNPPGAYIRHGFTTDTARLHDAIGDIVQTHVPRDIRPVFDAASRYVDSPQDKIVLISDAIENLPDAPFQVQTIGVGGKARNIAITRFSMEVSADRYEFLLGVHNFTDTATEVDVQLAVENVPLDERSVSVPPTQTKSLLFSGEPKGLEGKVLTGHLSVDDDFSLDNTVSVLLSAAPTLRILLVSDNPNSLLPELLNSYGTHVTLDVVDPTEFHGTGDADVAFFEGDIADFSDFSEVAPQTHLVFIHPGDNLPFLEENNQSVEIETAPVRVIAEDTGHPLMAGLSLLGLQVRGSKYRSLPLWGHSLVETEKGPLIWMGTRSDTRLLVFEFDAFNLETSPFALTIPEAPRFIYQCLAWLEAGTAPLQPVISEADGTRHAFRTGDAVKITLERHGQSFRIQKPDGENVEGVDTIFDETDQVGVYTVFAEGAAVERFTVNLLSAAESALPHTPTPSSVDVPETAAVLQPMLQEVWQGFAVVAFLLLLIEWWVYHRERAPLVRAVPSGETG